MKKTISVLLSVIMLFSLCVPFSAIAADEKNQIIYIGGYGSALYKNNVIREAERIYDIDVDMGEHLEKVMEPCLTELAKALVSGDYTAYCDELYNAVAPLYSEVKLDNNGEASNGSGAGEKNPLVTPNRKSQYLSYFYFLYDWRLSPIVIAKQLKDYIDDVLSHSGKEKINLVGRCLGANIVSSYIAKYPEHAQEHLDSVVFYMPSSEGLEMLGALFSGNIVIDPEKVEKFANFYIDDKGKDYIDDPYMRDIVKLLVTVMRQLQILGVGTETLEFIIEKVKDNLIPRLVRDTYGSFPSFWAMVDANNYQAAKDFSFKGVEEEYAGMIEKLDDYYCNVQLPAHENYLALKEKGVRIAVIAKYNLPALPVYENCDEQSDGFSGVENLSFGATSAKFGEALSPQYLQAFGSEYISPDKIIDASTCLFPDTTWFVKNLTHNATPECVEELMSKIFYSEKELTVFDSEKFPQYILYDGETQTLSPLEAPEEDNRNPWVKFFDYLKDMFKHFFEKIFALFQNSEDTE